MTMTETMHAVRSWPDIVTLCGLTALDSGEEITVTTLSLDVTCTECREKQKASGWVYCDECSLPLAPDSTSGQLGRCYECREETSRGKN
jgi:hypothetical protein